MNLFRRLFFIASISLVLCSCKDIFGDWWPYDRNEASTTSKGSTFQILQEKGNFSIFLSALERTEYSGVVNGAGLVTVFAPTDDAFRAYLNEEFGTTDLNAIEREYPGKLELAVAFHIVRFSYSTEDLYGFTTQSTAEHKVDGDGSAYRYKTYARKSMERDVNDPITNVKHIVYHKEEWLPVISSRLFYIDGKKSTDPKADYEKLFPGGSWLGEGDHLYVGAAHVTEAGIPSDNGYIYVIDKVVKPLPTIYEELSAQREAAPQEPSRLEGEYKLFTKIVQTLSLYRKDDDLTKLYGQPGESVTLRWTMAKPGDIWSLPAIAGEWPYNDEQGTDLLKSMSYAVTAAIPNDEALGEWMDQYFAGWKQGSETLEELISRMPYIHLYQIAASHLFDKRALVLPSQLSSDYGIVGLNGENYKIAPEDIEEELYCSNGVIYGLNKVLVSPLFTESVVSPLLQAYFASTNYTYNWYVVAFMERDNYRTVIGKDDYTLFVRSDETLSERDRYGVAGSLRGSKFVPDLTRNSGANNLNSDEKVRFLNNSLVKGKLTLPKVPTGIGADTAYLRYYLTRQDVKPLGYVISHNGSFYSQQPEGRFSETTPPYYQMRIERYTESDNSMTFEVDGSLQEWKGDNAKAFETMANLWRQQLSTQVSMTLGGSGWWNCTDVNLDGSAYKKDYNQQSMIVFMFSDKAVQDGIANGFIPKHDFNNDGSLTERQKLEAKWALRNYLHYYMIEKSSLGYKTFPLPGLLPDGTQTEEKYSLRLLTMVDHKTPAEAKYLTVEWDPNDPMVMTIIAQNGDRIQTTRDTFKSTGQRIMPFISENNALYVIDEVFNHRTMLGN